MVKERPKNSNRAISVVNWKNVNSVSARKRGKMPAVEYKMHLSTYTSGPDKSCSQWMYWLVCTFTFHSSKRQKFEQIQSANLDADDPVDDDDDSDNSDGSDSEDDSMLLAELAKIRKERAAEQAQKVVSYRCFVGSRFRFPTLLIVCLHCLRVQEIEKKQEEERIRMENIFSGNPLLNYTANQAPKADLKVSISPFTISCMSFQVHIIENGRFYPEFFDHE